MSHPLPDQALNQMFRNARTSYAWADKDVPETLVRAAYDLLKMGPTSANNSPARFYFVRSSEAKAKLEPHLGEGNRAKTMAAPWTAIVAWDTKYYDHMAKLFPHNPGSREWFAHSEAAAFDNGFRNGTLQGAYLIMAARALGLDCGPMSGFDKAGVDATFFEPDETMKTWKSNFLVNIGYGTDENLFPRLPRFEFEEACRIA